MKQGIYDLAVEGKFDDEMAQKYGNFEILHSDKTESTIQTTVRLVVKVKNDLKFKEELEKLIKKYAI